MQKIITVVGARPQLIKAAMLSREIARDPDVEEIILHTGQHYDHGMSDVFFEEMQIPKPGYNLGVGGGAHGAMTGQQLEGIEKILLNERPDWLLVYGDTNSTLAGALAAAKLNIPVAHVEAGLRSFNRAMPEEVNRVLTDHMSARLFAPTQTAVDHLASEGLTKGVHFVGDIMYAAARFYGARLKAEGSTLLAGLGFEGKSYRLATVHRQENTDDPARLIAILSALGSLAKDGPLILPVHPRVRKMLDADVDLMALLEGVTLIDPVGFIDMIALMQGASLILTDSGGVQKEAYFHGTPALILRDETEWGELVTLGWAKLCPPLNSEIILKEAADMEGRIGDTKAAPYGAGDAAARILAHLKTAP